MKAIEYERALEALRPQMHSTTCTSDYRSGMAHALAAAYGKDVDEAISDLWNAGRSGPSDAGRSAAKPSKESVEEAIRGFFERASLEILDMGYSCPAGKVDFVTRDDDAVRFAFVKARPADCTGFDSAPVDEEDCRRWERIAESWLLAHSGIADTPFVFDLVEAHYSADRMIIRSQRNVLGRL